MQLYPETNTENLAIVFNRSIRKEAFPDSLKIVSVIALLKKRQRHDPNNYCPISLISLFDKIFEKILCKRLAAFFNRNKILYCHHYRFRKLFSTVLALIEVTDCIKCLNDKMNHIIGVFIDFKKAFHTIEHEMLMNKLDYYGKRGYANAFLTHDWQREDNIRL